MTLEFHTLEVSSVEPLTEDSVAITFDVPESLADVFAYLPGQHVTVRAMIDGQDVRRSYSICADATTSMLRIGVKRLEGGVFSTFATRRLRPGDRLDVMPPVGEFTLDPDGADVHEYVAFVAGSGITPVLSLVSTTLAIEPQTRWTVVFGNRTSRSIMFLEELEALKDRHPSRLRLVHVLSGEDTGLELTSGRIDAEKLRRMLGALIAPAAVDRWFLCGPYDMVMTARMELIAAGVAADAIADELFFAGPPVALPTPPAAYDEGAVELVFTLEGRQTTTTMLPSTSLLDAAAAVRTEAPYSCRGGMCATCKALIVEGRVTMDKNYALVRADLDAGFVLTCQSHPTSERLVVDFDSR